MLNTRALSGGGFWLCHLTARDVLWEKSWSPASVVGMRTLESIQSLLCARVLKPTPDGYSSGTRAARARLKRRSRSAPGASSHHGTGHVLVLSGATVKWGQEDKRRVHPSAKVGTPRHRTVIQQIPEFRARSGHFTRTGPWRSAHTLQGTARREGTSQCIPFLPVPSRG